MTNLDIGTQGAKRQSWFEDNPRELLRRIVEKNPNWGRERLLSEFKRAIAGKAAHLDVIIEYWFSNNYHSLIERPDTSERQHRKEMETAKLNQALEEKIQERVKIVLLDMVMPNGKKLRDCTGKECATLSRLMGAWLLRLSKQIKPTEIVGDVLTEKQVRTFYK